MLCVSSQKHTHTHTRDKYITSLFADTYNTVANISRVKWLLKKSDYHMNKFGMMNLNGSIVTGIRIHRIAKVIKKSMYTEIKQ